MEDDTLAFFRAIVSGKEDEVTRLLDADPAWLEAARHHLEDDEDHLMPLMVAGYGKVACRNGRQHPRRVVSP